MPGRCSPTTSSSTSRSTAATAKRPRSSRATSAEGRITRRRRTTARRRDRRRRSREDRARAQPRGQGAVDVGRGPSHAPDAPIRHRSGDAPGAPTECLRAPRPTGVLVDAFERWRGEVLDRLAVPAFKLAAPHATMKAFGTGEAPLTDADEERIAAVVEAWAAATQPIELETSALDVFDTRDEFVPVVLLAMSDGLRAALQDLWARAAAATFPRGTATTSAPTPGRRTFAVLPERATQARDRGAAPHLDAAPGRRRRRTVHGVRGRTRRVRRRLANAASAGSRSRASRRATSRGPPLRAERLTQTGDLDHEVAAVDVARLVGVEPGVDRDRERPPAYAARATSSRSVSCSSRPCRR